MERVLETAVRAFQGPRSIFFLFVGIAVLLLVLLEGREFFRLLFQIARERSFFKVLSRNPRAPLGWMAVAGFVILLLMKVKW